MKLEKIPFGFQDVYEGKADEAVENPRIVAVRGDATQSVKLIDPKTIELIVRGDGQVGLDDDPATNAFQVVTDGHIGDGEVELVNDFEYNVISPDATSVSFTKVRREPIPPTTPA